MYHTKCFTIFICIELCLLYLTMIVVMFHKGHQGHINGIPRGMKNYPIQLSRFSYYEHLQIAHLFDTMYIGNNVTKLLQRTLDGRSDKEKIIKICSDIQEANNAMKYVIELNNDGDKINIISLPWLLTEQQSNVVKEVI